MIGTLYRGSVKDVCGDTDRPGSPFYFEYTDAYSVFDWGRMPDALPRKGEALAVMAAFLFESLAEAATWQEFSRSTEALALRKGNRFGSAFNELGEELKRTGLKSHYLGMLRPLPLLSRVETGADLGPRKLIDAAAPSRHLVVQPVSVVKPAGANVMGRAVYDYFPTRGAPAPKLVPLEVVFRFGCPEGSSLIERVARDPGYLASLGFPDAKTRPGEKWDFPVLELFTKLETSDRPVGMGEALAISGLTASQLQDVLLRTAWVAGALKWIFGRHGLELADGKLEWATDEGGGSFLVDAIGPDELRILASPGASSGAGASRAISAPKLQLSKEFLRTWYRKTPWYEKVEEAKRMAKAQGTLEWKRLVPLGPPPLPQAERELAAHLYLALANTITGRAWFAEAWPLEKVVKRLQERERG